MNRPALSSLTCQAHWKKRQASWHFTFNSCDPSWGHAVCHRSKCFCWHFGFSCMYSPDRCSWTSILVSKCVRASLQWLYLIRSWNILSFRHAWKPQWLWDRATSDALTSRVKHKHHHLSTSHSSSFIFTRLHAGPVFLEVMSSASQTSGTSKGYFVRRHEVLQ